jgi:hypothetical protein
MKKLEVKKYRKKPVEIEAIRVDSMDYDGVCDIMAWCGGRVSVWDHDVDYLFYIDTLEGQMHVRSGDWIIKGVKGEFYPCKADIFEATYDEVR